MNHAWWPLAPRWSSKDHIRDMLYFDTLSPNKAKEEVMQRFGSNVVRQWFHQTWLLPSSCILFPPHALKFYQISFLEFISSAHSYSGSASSAQPFPPMPFWNMDDKGRWLVWLLRTAKWNLLANLSPGCKYFSACHRAEGCSAKSRKGWR